MDLTLKNSNVKNKIYTLLLILILSLGVFYRLYNSNTALYGDEATRVLRFGDSNWYANHMKKNYNPPQTIGSSWIHNFLINISAKEWVVRLNGIIPGLLSLLIAFLLAKEIFKSRFAILSFLTLFALNPRLLDYTKELKTFSLELFTILMLSYLTVLYLKSKDWKYILYIFILSIFGVLFSIPMIFLWPFSFVLIFIEAYKLKDKKQITAIIIITVITLILFILHFYKFIYSSNLMNKLSKSSYPKGYYNKPLSFINILKYFPWLFLKLFRFGFYAVSIDKYALNKGFSPIIKYIIAFISSGLYIWGIVVLFMKKKWKYLAIFFGPIVLLWFFSLIRKWPFEPDRMNVFIIANFIILAAYGIEHIKDWCVKKTKHNSFFKAITDKKSILKLIPVFLIIIYFSMQFIPNMKAISIKHNTEEVPELFDYLLKTYPNGLKPEGKKTLLFINSQIRDTYLYYRDYHPEYSKKLKPYIKKYLNYKYYITPNLKYVRKNYLNKLINNKYAVFIFGKYERYLLNEIKFLRSLHSKKYIKIIDTYKRTDALMIYIKSNIYEENISSNKEKEKINKILKNFKFKNYGNVFRTPLYLRNNR